MPKPVVPVNRLSPARSAAFAALEAISEGSYASDILRDLTAGLSSRDAGLAAQIVFGSLRFQGQLDYLIFRYSGRKPAELDFPVQIALRAAIFQLRYLERVPAHAAVDESVEFVKAHKRAASGLVNAVLRKVNRDRVNWPDLATELSCPAWLIGRWQKHFGEDTARGIAAAALVEPTPYIRVVPGASVDQKIEIAATDVPGAFRLLSPLRNEMRLHDIGSQAIVPLLDLQPGNTYLDLCAAPGNKTLQALETPLSRAIACDISPKRIQDVPAVCPRVLLDASDPLPFGTKFDRVFIDAPCSGTGTLARNPEIKWRVQEQDFFRFGQKQFAILQQALKVLAPGGKLVYATCSLEKEENEEVIARSRADHPKLRCTKELWRLPGREEGDGFYAAVLEY